jgi:UDP-GlcNAc:undecaprenyl-phosphate GlcNAc-1-phosphate transferase
VVVIVAFALALVATPAASAVARRTGLLDHPGALKVQTRPVPYLGGLAVFVAACLGPAIGRPAWLVPLALALALGTLDDARTLTPRVRLAGEVVVGLVAGALVPTGAAQPWAALATALVVVVLINAVNLIDGLDTLAAGVSLVGAIGFAIALDGDDRTVALALAGALAGFLVYNRPPARVYLGDGGSYLLGTALAVLLVSAWRPEREVALSLGAVLFVAVPVAEVAFAVVRRARARAPLFTGDRSHIYDKMVERGLSTGTTSLICAGLQAAFVVAGLLATRTEPVASLVIVIATALAFLGAAAAGGFLSSASPRGAR